MPFAIYECYCNCKCYGECYQEFSFDECIDCICHDREVDTKEEMEAEQAGLSYLDWFQF